MATYDSNRRKRTAGTFNTFGRTKAPIQIGASGVNSAFTPQLRATQFRHSKTFSGFTPGVQVALLDRLFAVEANDTWQAQIVRGGQTNSFGHVTFHNLRDSIYSLIVIDLEYSHESVHDVVIGNPEYFDTIAHHAIPSAPDIYAITYEDIGYTTAATLFWQLGSDGINGYPEVHYTVSGANEWILYNRYEDTTKFSATVQPLSFGTDYQFKVRLLNEDLLAGPYSNIVSISTSDLTISGTTSSGTSNYSQLLLYLDFEKTDDLFYDQSPNRFQLTGGNPVDYTTDGAIYGQASYENLSGVCNLEINNSNFYLSASPPYHSFVVEGTYSVYSGVSPASDFALIGSNTDQGIVLQLSSHPTLDYISNARFIYGDGLIIDVPISTEGKRQTWLFGETKHVVAVWDASDESELTAKLYLDGYLVGSGTAAYAGTISENAPIHLFNHYSIQGFRGTVDEFKMWKWVGDISPDDSDAHIKAAVPAPGVFNTGHDYPKILLDSRATLDEVSPELYFYNQNSGLFARVSASGLLFDPDGATANYVLVTDANGNASWAITPLQGEAIGNIDFNSRNVYFTEHNNGNSSSTTDIKWTSGHKHVITLDNSPTLTFTDPAGPCNLLLRIVQDGSGGREITWPSSVKWPGGTKPTLTSSGTAQDIVTFYYNGDYYGVASLAFE